MVFCSMMMALRLVLVMVVLYLVLMVLMYFGDVSDGACACDVCEYGGVGGGG